MNVRVEVGREKDVPALVALRAAVAGKLTTEHGQGPWSRLPTENGVRLDLRNSTLLVARESNRLVGTLRLAAKKPWAIDRSYFTTSMRPLYVLSMAVLPDLQRQGIGRFCLEEACRIARQRPADVLRLDAYDSPAGAGPFYARCGFEERGRVTYRGVPLIYYEMLLGSHG